MHKELSESVKQLLMSGTVIPAHPLALTQNLQLDEERQRLLTKYYMASGAGGVAVGVHTTQFEIRKPEINLLESVLRIAADEIDKAQLQHPFLKVAGICGPTEQALKEAELAAEYGYHLGLVSNGGLNEYSEAELIKRTEAISAVIPVFGFYLQPAVGGRLLSYEFWRDLAAIPNVHAIKIAAFNRYQTIDVVRAVCDSARRNEIALYTGNDDNIIADLLTPYQFTVNGEKVEKRFAGGLLGHWAVWTKKAVELLNEIKYCIDHDYAGVETLLSKGIEVTDMNAVIFDAKNSFKGCIPGIHEVLRRQGILEGRWCLHPEEELSAGQMEDINRIYKNYQHLTDDEFVKEFLDAISTHSDALSNH
ncbi:MAG: dihydrodipicolinate synthase family protein [Chitinophagaceae bacterium]|nr:dihydrodipicolinate synthase family protein [Chitinophagaceae bacterium]